MKLDDPIHDNVGAGSLRDCLITMICCYYKEFGNVVGGNLHIVLSDGNVENHNVKWCLGLAESRGDFMGVAIAKYLLLLTEEDREELIMQANRLS